MANEVGKWLILTGAVILAVGVVIYFFGASFKWLGHLPGDIRVEKPNFSFYFPITTLVLVNLVLFLIVRIWRWMQ